MFISYEHCNSPARLALSHDDRAGGIPTYRERSSIMRNLFLSALVLAFMCVAVPVQAGLTLNVSPTSEDLFFTGTDSGTPDNFPGVGENVLFFTLDPADRFETTDSAIIFGAVDGVNSISLETGGTGTSTGTGVSTDTGVSTCLLYTSPSPRDGLLSRMPSSA